MKGILSLFIVLLLLGVMFSQLTVATKDSIEVEEKEKMEMEKEMEEHMKPMPVEVEDREKIEERERIRIKGENGSEIREEYRKRMVEVREEKAKLLEEREKAREEWRKKFEEYNSTREEFREKREELLTYLKEHKGGNVSGEEVSQIARDLVDSALETIRKKLELFKTRVENDPIIPEEQKQEIISEIDRHLEWLNQKDEVSPEDIEELKNVLKELREKWVEIKKDIRKSATMIMVERFDYFSKKAESMSQKIEELLSAFREKGFDVSKAEEKFQEYQTKVEEVKNRIEELKGRLSTLPPEEEGEMEELRQEVEEIKQEIRETFNLVKEIVKELKELRGERD